MYDVLPSFILGFHGCDHAVAEAVFSGAKVLKGSRNEYDWLGHGVYFWENSPKRALAYATQLRDHPRNTGSRVDRPAVVGAVIDLGRCLNLLDHEMIRLVRDAYRSFEQTLELAGARPPANAGGKDLLRRSLDCAVIQHLHTTRDDGKLPAFDSVRGVFIEGAPVYPTAGFFEKSHIQVCVRNARCIKGYFRVLPEPIGVGAVG